MKRLNHLPSSLAAVLLIATGGFSTSATADMEVVAELASQTRLSYSADVLELDADKHQITVDYAAHLQRELGVRLADEFESAKRSSLLASDFADQILDALDERLPDEVDNLISVVN